ncbi:unnamed protein product [Medioppia subpectinata]|uniref:Cytochrome P450 n=1 Tax=Medioppia subpectinata TaxID=1979941 RepID=A0A7R9KZ23_9ACAR|nr:unnamed protein product [Medioppia subpectinata]CAG2112196.1 unnamed protein product [Medioppia subpectinata]
MYALGWRLGAVGLPSLLGVISLQLNGFIEKLYNYVELEVRLKLTVGLLGCDVRLGAVLPLGPELRCAGDECCVPWLEMRVVVVWLGCAVRVVLELQEWRGWAELSSLPVMFMIRYDVNTWKRALSYWKDRNIPTPKAVPIFGNLLSNIFLAKPFVEMDWYRAHGRLYGVYNGNKPGLTIAEPELVKQVLVKDFHKFRNRMDNGSRHKIFSKNMFIARDDDWKRIRAIASPTFTSGKMKKMYALINECSKDFINNLDKLAANKSEVELKQLMGAFTMDVIASTAFATKTNTYANPDNPFTTKANNIFHFPLWKAFVMTALPSFITKIQAIRQLINGSTNSDFFVDFSRNLLNERKSSNKKHNDFFQLLMDVERSDGDVREDSDANEAHHVNEGKDELEADAAALSNVIEKKLTEDEILAQCFLFFIAGYETTATTLSYCTYELALNPDLQDRLYEECKEAFNEKGEISYDVLSRLPFIDALLSETLRNYPPLLRLQREAMEDIELGDTGLKVEKGVVAEIPVYAIHHDPDHYPEPFVFRPDRFMPENRDNIKPYTYIPFGSGPRNCIGMRFALLEAKLALAKMSQQFRFSRVANTDVPVIFNKGRFLLQAKQLIVGVERR